MTVLASGGVADPAVSGIITSGHVASGVLPKEAFVHFFLSGATILGQGLNVVSGGQPRTWWAVPETYTGLAKAELYARNLSTMRSGDIAFAMSITRVASGIPQASGIITSAPIYNFISGSEASQLMLPVSSIFLSGASPGDSVSVQLEPGEPYNVYRLQGLRLVYT